MIIRPPDPDIYRLNDNIICYVSYLCPDFEVDHGIVIYLKDGDPEVQRPWDDDRLDRLKDNQTVVRPLDDPTVEHPVDYPTIERQ
jgi:hypothetical protein